MIYYIFRHGETLYSKNDIQYGENIETAEILPEAIPVIERLAEYLKDKISDFNFTSPFKRAMQTTEIVTKITGKIFVPDERLREESLSKGSESLEELVKRLKDFKASTENINAGSIAVCSHGWPISTLTALLIKGSVSKTDLGNFPKCGQLLIIEHKTLKTIDFN
jgi:broad specificity phosphatase PhoE